MTRQLVLGAGGLLIAALIGGTASAAGVATGHGDRTTAQATSTPTATATGTRPAAPGKGRENDGRPEGVGPGKRSESSASGATGATGAIAVTGSRGLGNRPRLPAQASPRAKAAVEAAAKKHELLRDRLAALKAIPKDADRAEAVKAVMADFGDLFHLVADAVHAVEPGKSTPTATATATGTATGTAASTATGTPTASATAQP